MAVAQTPCKGVPIKIAVLDTGFGFKGLGHSARLCKYGHKDFSNASIFDSSYDTVVPVPKDTHGHGTNVAGVIDSYASKSNTNYCLVIIKYWSYSQTNEENLRASIKAYEYASNIGANFVNYSGGGPFFNEKEYKAVEKYLDRGGTFIAAAGNENSDIDDLDAAYYPAKYDNRIIIVGNMSKNGVRSSKSNYGNSVNLWEIGENVEAYGIVLTGTSQSAAVATGKIVSESHNKCDIGS